ncbi:hypothetical protein SAMN05421790_11169 [Kroppenstedtia eburnea]|uniref:Uncharacterized protein n=1 Tax=Kroppenstedtia eburnea TaxID=714067 RepID=A0A1N7P534_9BACL|nr:hypothetical protein SAMN05421790_11169 [Kroppenstedtia eburnea]
MMLPRFFFASRFPPLTSQMRFHMEENYHER